MFPTRATLAALIVVAICLSAACSDDDNGDVCNSDGVCDPGETTSNCAADCPVCVVDGVCDSAAGENPANCNLDCGAVDCDLTLTGDDHDYLVSQIYLPTTPEAALEIGVDLSGNLEVDNRLGAIVSLLAATSPDFDVNEDVNGAITAGETLMLLRLRTEQFGDDADVLVQIFKGAVHTDTPVFDGDDTVAMDADSAIDDYVCGAINGGALASGPNSIRMPFPLPGMGALMLDMQAVQLVGAVTADGWTEVMLGGGVPAEQIDTVLFPALLVWMNEVIQDDPTGAMAEGMIELLDGTCNNTIVGCESVIQGEGECDNTATPPVITDTEIRCNMMMTQALSPDIDLDGDGTMDVISVGLRIEAAVPVTIVTP